MLKWITARVFNRFDPFWIAFMTLCIHDGHYMAAAITVLVGAVISGVLEGMAEAQATKAKGAV